MKHSLSDFFTRGNHAAGCHGEFIYLMVHHLITKSKTPSHLVLFFLLVKRRVHRVKRRALPRPLPRPQRPRPLHPNGLKPQALLLTLPQALRHGIGRGLPLHLTLQIAR